MRRRAGRKQLRLLSKCFFVLLVWFVLVASFGWLLYLGHVYIQYPAWGVEW